MRNRQSVVPFRGRITEVIKRRYGKRRKLSDRERGERAKKGLEDRVYVNVRRKEIDGLFKIYTHIITPDDFLTKLMAKEMRFKNYRVLLLEKFDEGTMYLRRKFRDDMSESFLQETDRMRAELEKLSDFMLELTKMKTPVDDRMRRLRVFVRKTTYKTRLVEAYSDLLERIFKIMGIGVSTKTKRNSALNLSYIQFSLPSSLESALNQSSKEEAQEHDILKRAYDIQQKELETRLEQRGFIVRQTRDFLGEGGATMATVAYDPQVSQLEDPPRKPYKRKGETRESYEARLEASGYPQLAKEYSKKLEPFVRGIYSPYLIDKQTSDYRVFDTKEEYIKAYKTEREKELILASQMPVVEEDQVQIGVKKVTKRDGTIEEKPVYEYLSKITYEGVKESYPLTRYEVSALSGDTRTAQLSDRKGVSANDITRVVKVKSMILGDNMVDVIVEGKYKGFLLEDLVNASGRLIEGSYFTRTSEGVVEKVEMIETNFEENEYGQMVADGDEVSFLELGEGGSRAKYMKVLKNRLREPYITLSADKSRLVLGLPSSNASKQDRNAMKELAKIMKPAIEQKKDPRLAPTTNGLNPFYYFDPSAYEAIRDTLGSCAISKPALDFLDDYYKELTARDRALNEENLRNFTPEALGGFVSEFKGRPFRFNNKQKEAMAWLEANNYSGLMALDTGVGKTLLAGGAMRHYMKTKEASDSTKKFLFVSPKRLQGNFTREMKDFMTDHGVVDSRIMEMNYTKFAKIVRGIDRVGEFLKEKDPAKLERKLRAIPSDFWKDPDNPSKGGAYKDSTAYFKDKYAICFFDEVNEALTGTKRKALSDLKHPRKILLTASAMEKDPIDLYRFVAVAKGSDFSTEKERAFAERFGNVIGGRFIGLKKGTREEFNTWVKANAYFAFKQDVDFEEIGMPQLQTPTAEVITIKLEDRVEKEYRRLAKDFAKELSAMVKKYKEVVKGGADYRDSSFKGLVDFASLKSVSKIKDLITLTTNPASYFGDKDMENPKLDQAEKILMDRPNKTICYFSSDESVVAQNAKRCSLSGVGGIHVALKGASIDFYRAGKVLGTIKKETGKTEIKRLDDLTRRYASLSGEFQPRVIDYSFLLNHAKAGKKLLIEVRDLFELVEFHLFKYESSLEEEEKEAVEAPFYKLLDGLMEKDVKKIKSAKSKLKTEYYTHFGFIAEQWAISVTKKIFKDNGNIKSLSCTDEYAKGFNFQFVSTVVHLDRGEKFDSELVKQRTARAYRTGQARQVEVIYLDAVISEGGDRTFAYGQSEPEDVFTKSSSDMTIDEMKDLIQGADQDFFMDIIKKGMETDLIADYDSVQRSTGEAQRVNKNLLAMLIDPTSTNLSSVQKELEEENTNPLKSLALNPNRFRANPYFHSAINAETNPMEARKTADLSGLSSIVDYQLRTEQDIVFIEEGHVLSQSDDVSLEVIIEENLDLTKTVYNKSIEFSECLPKDAPSRLIFGQIVSARIDKNVSSIKADMSPSDLMTLPSLGFNTDLSLSFLTVSESELSDDEKEIKRWLEDNDRITNGNGVSLTDLFLCLNRDENELVGQKWWAENGRALNGLTLSLNENKPSMKVLNVYFKMKCNEFDLPISEYLTRPTEPFDVDDPSCWEAYMDRASKAEIEKIISTYSSEFKIAFYSSDMVRELTPQEVLAKSDLIEGGFAPLVEEAPAMSDSQTKIDSLLEEAWISVSKSIVRNSLIREKFMDEGDYQTASDFEDKE